MTQLQVGDPFPALSGKSVAHGQVSLPDDIPASHFAIVLAYRAHW